MDNIRVVLVGIRNSGNIGSAARAMKNMGVRDLALVNPDHYHTAEVYNLAWGAEELVREARVYPALRDAIADCGMVVGTTRRRGRHRRPVVDLRQALPRIAAAAERNRVALLFGREDKGLSNEELALCQMMLAIPTSSLMPSLNVAQAVMVLCYELFSFTGGEPALSLPRFASHEELCALYERLESALRMIGYGEKGHRKILNNVIRTLTRIFGRSGLAPDEFNALHGICQQIERYVEWVGSGKQKVPTKE